MEEKSKEYTKAFNWIVETTRKSIGDFAKMEKRLKSENRLERENWMTDTRRGASEGMQYILYVEEERRKTGGQVCCRNGVTNLQEVVIKQVKASV